MACVTLQNDDDEIEPEIKVDPIEQRYEDY